MIDMLRMNICDVRAMPSIRTVRVKSSAGVVHEYPQLVESFRKNGRPSVRVLLSLKDWAPGHVDNLRVALKANRSGHALVISDNCEPPPKPAQALPYLDAAAALEVWRRWGLGDLFDELLSRSRHVPSSAVVAMLVVQRLLAPASKLAAAAWYPETALVEMLGIDPARMNNDRIHHVLEDIERVESELMNALASRYQRRDGAFATLFIDVTDTWFEGRGPTLAEKGKTKLGHVRRKVGIVMLCNEHGYPLRWKTVPGNQHDSKSMLGLLAEAPDVSWLHELPVVLDRALGKPAHLRALLSSKLRFITAMTSDQIRPLAGDQLPQVELDELDDDDETALKQVKEAICSVGFRRVDDRLYVFDVGVREVDARVDVPQPEAIQGAADADVDKTVQAVVWARQINELITSNQAQSPAQAGRALGIDRFRAHRVARLCALAENIQQEILDGALVGSSLMSLYELAAIDEPTKQQDAFDALCATLKQGQHLRSSEPFRRTQADQTPEPFKVRFVAYVNPEMLIHVRRTANEAREQVRTKIDQLNGRLTNARSRSSRDSAAGAVHTILRRNRLVGIIDFDIVQVEVEGKARWKIDYSFNEQEWERRRATDGVCLLAVHPDLTELSTDSVCKLYRAKDRIEKGFQTLKNHHIISVRPVRHQTDIKVRAHVTICMLALLLERTLARQLVESTDVRSAQAALEILRTCVLNRYADKRGNTTHYVTPELSALQTRLLACLGMLDLADDAAIADRIQPR
jgi:hypothetical protein